MQITILPLPAPESVTTDSELAGVLRAWAEVLGVTTRRTLLHRARSYFGTEEGIPDRLKSVLGSLQGMRDILGQPGQQAAAPAPLRAMRLDDSGSWMLVGGPRTVHLEMPCPVDEPFLRIIRISPHLEDAFRQRLRQLQGIETELEKWLRAPPPKPLWLQAFINDLESRATPFALDEGEEAKCYTPELQEALQDRRWKALRKSHDAGRLLRVGWGPRARFYWAALAEGTLKTATPVKPDEARRMQFAFDALVGNPTLVSVTHQSRSSQIALTSFLPAAEFRLVRALSRRISGGAVRACEMGEWNASIATNILKERLGVRVENDDATDELPHS